MQLIQRASRPAIALMLMGAFGCTTKKYYNSDTTTPATPAAVLDCTKQVYTEQPTLPTRVVGDVGGAVTGSVTLSGVVAGNTFAIGGVTFTAVTSATPTTSQFTVGADDAATAVNLADAIANRNATSKLVLTAVASNGTITFGLTPAYVGKVPGKFISMTGTSGKFGLAAASVTLTGGGLAAKPNLTVAGKQFRDLNGNGTLEPFEDWRLLEICRAQDLVKRMPVPMKVGLMSEGSTIGSGTVDGSIPLSAITHMVNFGVRQALIRLGQPANVVAAYLNNIQELAEVQSVAIPFVVTADPVHGFGMSTSATGVMTSAASTIVSPWPYPMGLGAINDAAETRLYGDSVRREFMGMGFRWQLGPMADLATEPRWARVQNVFGDNALHVAKHTEACIEGFQNNGDKGLKNGIAATMKHFPGAGPDEDGKDSHNTYGKYNVYPGGNFYYHQIPFKAAIAAGAAAVMPCYSIFKGQLDVDPLQVGSAYSKEMITDYMKTELGFTGMVTSDWGVIAGNSPHGVEALSVPERVALFVKAGSNQLGSDSYTNVQAAFDQGLLDENDINGAASKILEMSFKLGIFENPYVADTSGAAVRSESNLRDGLDAQKKAIVMLKNTGSILPIAGTKTALDYNADGTIKVLYDGVVDHIVQPQTDATKDGYQDFLGYYDYTQAAAAPALAVAEATGLADADVAVLRITARKGTYSGLDAGVPLSFDAPFPGLQNDGGLAAAVKDAHKVIDLFRARDGYTDAAGNAVAATNPKLKIVLVMHMDRPGIVKPFVNGLKTLDETFGQPGSYPLVSNEANVNQQAVTTTGAAGHAGVEAFLVEFGAFDRAVLDFLFNQKRPLRTPGAAADDLFVYGTARLPIEIPSTDAEVAAQFEDMPSDTWTPTYKAGSGSSY